MHYSSGIPSYLVYDLLFALCSLKNNLHQHLFITSEENIFPSHYGTIGEKYLLGKWREILALAD
jgi:hypothetical protein